MKHAWIVFLFAACVVRVSSPFHWSTRLPSGDSISCSCNSSDCTKYGASCH